VFTIAFAQTTQSIQSKRGKYQLNFDVTYKIGVARGIQTMIELPSGYTYTGTVIGAGYYVSVSELQNVMYMTKLAEDHFETNIIFHIVTPEGFEKKLILTVFGVDKDNAIYAIQFEDPNVSEINNIVREMKAKYDEQAALALSEQEKSVKKTAREKTLQEIRTMEIKTPKRGRKVFGKKGVKGFVDGIYNNDGTSYIRIISNVENQCNKLRLEKISHKKSSRDCYFFAEDTDFRGGNTVLIFETPEFFPVTHKRCSKKNFNHYKNVKYKFHYKIWDEKVTQKLKIS
jgi:hypothetical protein